MMVFLRQFLGGVMMLWVEGLEDDNDKRLMLKNSRCLGWGEGMVGIVQFSEN